MLPLIPLALTLAPYLTRLLAGDRAGDTAQAVARVVETATGTSDPAQAEAALAADPAARDAVLRGLAEIALEHERVAAADRADARAMARSGGALAWGAGAVTVLSFLLLAAVLGALVFAQVPDGNREVLNMLAGSIAAMAGAAVTFWVGSSAGSAAKSGSLGGPFGQGRR
jgi:hypothetical protein